jgi:hypothetical protein
MDGLADDIGIAREMPLPEAVTDHRHRSGVPTAVQIVIRCEDAAAHGRHAEDAEEIAAGPQAFRELALAARSQVEPVGAEGQGSRESLLAIAYLLPDRIGETALRRVYLHQSLRILHRQRTQHHSVEDAENGRVCADAQRQR